ncbi:CG11044 [Drosophila busckii]|uniref:CG11044 n=1 Tax=Drosophila busckii TaxID=30019 RepID=A0A0M3QUW4_DROBS|nr:F-box only protein 39 [Drosophila busckii]ALC41369.1 CG11044 [Drosophila busckii]
MSLANAGRKGSAQLEVMQKAGWKIDENEKACYIDIEEDNDADSEHLGEETRWSWLPNVVLEQIFTYLTPKERYYASLVCRQWYSAFYLPTVWHSFLVDDRTLTRAKYNYYSGWQYCLDHMRTQMCLARIGRHLRGVEFRPWHSFNNIYQFMTMLSWSIDKGREAHPQPDLAGMGRHIRSLVYHFPCNMAQSNDPEGMKLFGTGGQLLKGLKELLLRLTDLHTLKLVDFVLERFEANHLLDEVVCSCCTKMRVLNLVNVTTTHCPIMHVGLFLNLQVLTISPQNIDDDVLSLLADTKLRHLHLLQNCYTPNHLTISACGVKAWRSLKRTNPRMRVHLRVENLADGEVVLQPEAPVHSITYWSPLARIRPDLLLRMVDHYKHTLAVYGHELLPRFSSPKSFNSRIDSLLLLLCRQCAYMDTLIVREKVSTCTLLLIARTAKNLRHLHVRRFGVILRCDWPRHPEWSDDFFRWLKRNSRSYAAVEREISTLLGYPWRLLSDQEFKQLTVNVKTSV